MTDLTWSTIIFLFWALHGSRYFCADAQANFLSSKRRLTARRLDWLVHVIYDRVVEKYQISQHIMDSGVAINCRAYHATSAAILRAKECPDRAVRISGSHAEVPSRSTQGLVYTDHLVEGAEIAPKCSCQAIGQCWHQVKVLMLKGATEAQLLQLIGERYGTAAGGYAALWQAIRQQQRQPEEQDAATNGAASLEPGGEGVDALEVQEAAATPMDVETACLVDTATEQQSRRGLHRRTAKQIAQAALDSLMSLGAAWDDESPNWQHVTHQLGLAINGVEKALSAPDMAALEHRHMTLASNPDAPAGNSTKRLVSWLDPCSGRQQRAQPTALRSVKHALLEHVQPFVTDKRPPKKPASELEHIERMLKKVPARADGSTHAPAVQHVAALGENGEVAMLVGSASECPLSVPPSTAPAGHPVLAGPSKPPSGLGRPKPATAQVAASTIGMRSSGRERHRPASLEE